MARFPEQQMNESSRAYAAFILYCGMGADRSIVAVAQKCIKSVSLIRRWCHVHTWVERAKQYDAQVADDIAAEHTRRYLQDLDDHKLRYAQAGKILYVLAQQLAVRFNTEIDDLAMTPNTLAVLHRTYQIAGDLEAHALGIDQLLASLGKQQDQA